MSVIEDLKDINKTFIDDELLCILGSQGLVFIESKERKSKFLSWITNSPITHIGFYYKSQINHTKEIDYRILIIDILGLGMPEWLTIGSQPGTLGLLLASSLINRVAIRSLNIPSLEHVQNYIDSDDVYSGTIKPNGENRILSSIFEKCLLTYIGKFINGFISENMIIEIIFKTTFPNLPGPKLCIEILNKIITDRGLTDIYKSLGINTKPMNCMEILEGGSVLLNSIEWIRMIKKNISLENVDIYRNLVMIDDRTKFKENKLMKQKYNYDIILTKDFNEFIDSFLLKILEKIKSDPGFFEEVINFFQNKDEFTDGKIYTLGRLIYYKNITSDLIYKILERSNNILDFFIEVVNRGDIFLPKLRKMLGELNYSIKGLANSFDLCDKNPSIFRGPNISNMSIRKKKNTLTKLIMIIDAYSHIDIPHTTYDNNLKDLRRIILDIKEQIKNNRRPILPINKLITIYNNIIDFSGSEDDFITHIDTVNNQTKFIDFSYDVGIEVKLTFRRKHKTISISSKYNDFSIFDSDELIEILNFLRSLDKYKEDFYLVINKLEMMLLGDY